MYSIILYLLVSPFACDISCIVCWVGLEFRRPTPVAVAVGDEEEERRKEKEKKQGKKHTPNASSVSDAKLRLYAVCHSMCARVCVRVCVHWMDGLWPDPFSVSPREDPQRKREKRGRTADGSICMSCSHTWNGVAAHTHIHSLTHTRVCVGCDAPLPQPSVRSIVDTPFSYTAQHSRVRTRQRERHTS